MHFVVRALDTRQTLVALDLHAENEAGAVEAARNRGLTVISARPQAAAAARSWGRASAFPTALFSIELVALLGARVVAVIEAVLVDRFLQRVDLRPRHLDFRLADLREVFRGDVARKQPDDDDHDEQFQEREAGGRCGACSAAHLHRGLHVSGARRGPAGAAVKAAERRIEGCGHTVARRPAARYRARPEPVRGNPVALSRLA